MVAFFGVFWIILSWRFQVSFSDVLAKSSLQICENAGDSEDPYNVVDQKACEKKLIVTLSVRSGQNGSEFLRTVTNVSKVYDQTEKEMARLYNPFVITLAKTPVTLTYPYYYLGTVNNKPKEEVVIPKGKGWRVSGSYHACSDAWGDDGAACGFAKDQSDKPIWDSQGFCCRCTEQEKWRGTFQGALDSRNPYSRGGINCRLFGDQASAHCMKYDDLWYTVNEIGLWRMDFNIHVKAYDQVIEKIGNKTKTKWVDGGEIIVGPTVRTGRGKYDRIYASFIGEFQSHKQFPVLSTKYLLIPYASDKIDPKTHPQFRNGPHDYMLIDKHEVNYRSTGPHQCDKIGVTYSAFRAQAPMGCSQKQQACLKNQPKDYFYWDKARSNSGETPHYFPSKFGKLLGVKKHMDTDNFVLTYEVDEVVVRDCSVGILKLLEKSASINPQQTHTFTFHVKAQQWKGGLNYCYSQLFDSRRKLIDTANVTFKTTAPCVCATSCGCSCFNEGFKCVEREIKGSTKFKPKDSGVDLSFTTKIWNGIKNLFNKIKSFFDFFGEFQIFIYLAMGFLCLGGLKAFIGVRKASFSRFGLGAMATKRRNRAGQVVVMEYNDVGDVVDPETKEVIEPRNKTREVIFNIFFFFILPFLLLHRLVEHVRNRRKPTRAGLTENIEEGSSDSTVHGSDNETDENPGEEYCLAGKMTSIPGTAYKQHRFELLQNEQIYEIQDGQRERLVHSRQLNPADFSQVLDAPTMTQCLTLEPSSPCLNWN